MNKGLHKTFSSVKISIKVYWRFQNNEINQIFFRDEWNIQWVFKQLWLHNIRPTTHLLQLCAMYSYAITQFRLQMFNHQIANSNMSLPWHSTGDPLAVSSRPVLPPDTCSTPLYPAHPHPATTSYIHPPRGHAPEVPFPSSSRDCRVFAGARRNAMRPGWVSFSFSRQPRLRLQGLFGRNRRVRERILKDIKYSVNGYANSGEFCDKAGWGENILFRSPFANVFC